MGPPRRPVHVLIDAINGNDQLRGPDRYLLGLLHGLATIDPATRYSVCHAPWQRAFATAGLSPNFEPIELRPPPAPVARVAWHATVFPRLVRRLAPDLVHLPNVIFAPGLGRPSVMTVHDLAHFRFPEKFRRPVGLRRVMVRAAVRVPDLLIAVSDYTRREISERFPGLARRVRVVHEGAPEPRSRCASAEEPPFFLCVGQLERSKNVEGLISAFAASPQLREAGVRLRIAGKPGNAYARIARLADEAGRDRVQLLGYVSPESLERLYAGCLAFVLPSLVEGFGLVLLEAMAYGAPVVAMRTAAIPDVVGDAGLLVDPDEPAGLRAALERVHADAPLRERLRQLGRERVARFSWSEAARQTRRIYAELCP